MIIAGLCSYLGLDVIIMLSYAQIRMEGPIGVIKGFQGLKDRLAGPKPTTEANQPVQKVYTSEADRAKKAHEKFLLERAKRKEKEETALRYFDRQKRIREELAGMKKPGTAQRSTSY